MLHGWTNHLTSRMKRHVYKICYIDEQKIYSDIIVGTHVNGLCTNEMFKEKNKRTLICTTVGIYYLPQLGWRSFLFKLEADHTILSLNIPTNYFSNIQLSVLSHSLFLPPTPPLSLWGWTVGKKWMGRKWGWVGIFFRKKNGSRKDKSTCFKNTCSSSLITSTAIVIFFPSTISPFSNKHMMRLRGRWYCITLVTRCHNLIRSSSFTYTNLTYNHKHMYNHRHMV